MCHISIQNTKDNKIQQLYWLCIAQKKKRINLGTRCRVEKKKIMQVGKEKPGVNWND